MTLVKREQGVGPDLNTALMLKHPPDPLTNTGYIIKVYVGWYLLCFSIILYPVAVEEWMEE